MKPVSYSGIGLHTGVRATLTLKPAEENFGIWFRRVDLEGEPMVQALASNVVGVQRGTTIEDGRATVHTVEHVLAALNACGVDNAIVEMDDVEPPIADGSSKPFIEIIAESGVVEQAAARRFFEVKETIYFEMGCASIRIEPCDHFKVSCKVGYGESALDEQELTLDVTTESFANDMSKARTFCLYREIEGLMAAGLIKGGSLDNAVVIQDGAIISKDGLRYSDELVRHKMLDIVGDFYLLGCRLRGHVIAEKPGHPSNVSMAQKIMKENPDFFGTK